MTPQNNLDQASSSRRPATQYEWRCQGVRADDRLCNRLLGVSNNDRNVIHIKRHDHECWIVDMGGSAIAIKCHECGLVNWLFAESVPEISRNLSLEDL